MEISWNDFDKIDMRIGTIVRAIDFPQARNASYQLYIDFGAVIGVKKTSAQITSLYTKEDLIGRQIVGVVNFPPKQIGPIMSECLVLGAVSGKDVRLLHPDVKVENGLQIS
ncbi:tRNA-binding protein [Flavobacteriaceae bacterium]|nr:tRNA-binding protein [Flavobacteriaceae bacterium]